MRKSALFEVISVAFTKLNNEQRGLLFEKKRKFRTDLYKIIIERFKNSLSSGTGGQSNVHLRHREFNNFVNSFLK